MSIVTNVMKYYAQYLLCIQNMTDFKVMRVLMKRDCGNDDYDIKGESDGEVC